MQDRKIKIAIRLIIGYIETIFNTYLRIEIGFIGILSKRV